MNETKSFDAVRLMRWVRDRLSRKIEGMTAEQEIEYFQRRAAEFYTRCKAPAKANRRQQPARLSRQERYSQ